MPREQSSEALREGFQEHLGSGAESKRDGILMSAFPAAEGPKPTPGAEGPPRGRRHRRQQAEEEPRKCSVHAWRVPCLISCRCGEGVLLGVGTECVYSLRENRSRGGGARARLERWAGGRIGGLPWEVGLHLLRVSEKCEVRHAPDTI